MVQGGLHQGGGGLRGFSRPPCGPARPRACTLSPTRPLAFALFLHRCILGWGPSAACWPSWPL